MTLSDFIGLVAIGLREERFKVADIGCSGGIDPTWRLFGDRLSAIGFDASVSECRRLTAEETNPNVRYVAGFVDIAPDHPFARRAAGNPVHVDTMYGRFSAARTMELRQSRLAAASEQEKFRHNMWRETELADPEKPIFAPLLLEEFNWKQFDLLKIDIDGPDFRVLNSFDGLFGKFSILAAQLEVCLFGGDGETVHAFHNTDRFMRRQGYALVGLDNRTYSMRALPARYAITMPAQTVTGRPFLGDAFYALDPAALDGGELAARLTTEQLLKLAAIYAAWKQPDSAAELLLMFRERIAPSLDIDRALDLLASQAQGDVDPSLPYRDYMASFETDSPDFYPEPPEPPKPPPPEPTLPQRLRAAWAALRDAGYIERVEKSRRSSSSRASSTSANRR